MKIAFYFDNSCLGKWNWADFLCGHIALSGTDGQLLHLLSRMIQREDIIATAYFKNELPEGSPASFTMVSQIKEMASLAKNQGADILLLNNTNKLSDLQDILEACKSVNLPLVLWDQNGPYPEVRDTLANAEIVRRVVCVSQSQADCVRHHQVFNKIGVVYNALLHWEGKPVDEEFNRLGNVCFLGATIPQKGFHHVARAWPEIKTTVPNANLTVMGSGLLYNRQSNIGALGLGDPKFEDEHIYPFFGSSLEEARTRGVIIKGLMSPIEVRQFLKQQEVAIVNPNVSRGGSFETFCVSAIEAQAEGCAIVGGRRLGLRETVLDGETGLLVDSENHIASAVISLLSSPETARAMGRSGVKWVGDKFSISNADSKWMELLSDVNTGKPVLTVPFSFRRATLADYARALIRVFN